MTKDKFNWKKPVIKPERTQEKSFFKRLKKQIEVKTSEHSFSKETIKHRKQFFRKEK